ncbi:MAG: NADH-quinone oxidoreductase subunit NuoE [Candidatus Nanopelagicales bacterium]|nr:NADH-quinone oxidoreductase subunit NuoE [Candidatus Nanopelagicales bacterium]
MTISDQTLERMRELASRYPQPRSALLPMLHLVQSVDGEVTTDGINACAEVLGISPAEVTGVSTFYTMYKRKPVGEHHIGVCVNTLCGLLGGDAVYDALSERLGVGHNEPTADGKFSLERIECQAACTHAPVMTVDWEFIDDVTPAAAVDVVDRLERGEQVLSTRGPAIRTFQATEHTLAFPDDGLAGEGTSVDDKMLAGLRYAKEHNMSAPAHGQEA